MIQDRLQPNSKIGIFDAVKELQLNLSKCDKKTTVKLKDRIVQLGASIWRRLAIVSKSREINLDEILVDRKQKSSGEISVFEDDAAQSSITDHTVAYCIAIDGVCLLHTFEIPKNAQPGSDLAIELCKLVEEKAHGCSTVIVAFETYYEKTATRQGRKSKSKSQFYRISTSTSISKKSMKQLLQHEKTKTGTGTANSGNCKVFG